MWDLQKSLLRIDEPVGKEECSPLLMGSFKCGCIFLEHLIVKLEEDRLRGGKSMDRMRDGFRPYIAFGVCALSTGPRHCRVEEIILSSFAEMFINSISDISDFDVGRFH